MLFPLPEQYSGLTIFSSLIPAMPLGEVPQLHLRCLEQLLFLHNTWQPCVAFFVPSNHLSSLTLDTVLFIDTVLALITLHSLCEGKDLSCLLLHIKLQLAQGKFEFTIPLPKTLDVCGNTNII